MKILTIGLFLFLSACGSVGLKYTTDPYVMVKQSYRMMDEGRLLMAELLLMDAMALAQKEGNTTVMAETHATLGNLYKHERYHSKKWVTVFKKAGTYDPTYMKSIQNFTHGLQLYEQLGDESGSIKCMTGMASAYGAKGDGDKACDLRHQALDRYNEAKRTNRLHNEPVMLNPNYKNMGELLEAFIQHKCQKKINGL